MTHLPPASEAQYFNGEPCQHIIDRDERERLARIRRTACSIIRNRKVR